LKQISADVPATAFQIPLLRKYFFVGCYNKTTMDRPILIILTLIVLTFSCNSQQQNSNKATPKVTFKQGEKAKTIQYLDSLLSENITFFSDSLLNGNKVIIEKFINKNPTDTCGTLTYQHETIKSGFEGFKILEHISKRATTDTVFVIPPFNYCEEGQSYCFFDKSLPRLLTNSNCCHPDNLFVLPDIDEDGFKEIGIYYSSCASRYKSLLIYSLKSGKWKEIGSSVFDILTQDPEKVKFENLVTKTQKGKFKICNFIDGQTKWEAWTTK
jgi:hypothetical protein